MRMPAPTRCGSRISNCDASGGGKAPSSGGSVSRAGASFAAVTGRQSGAVEAAPLTMRRMTRSASSPPSAPPAIPASASKAPSVSSKASWRGQRPFRARCGHCAAPASGSQSRRRLRSCLRSRSSRSRGSVQGLVQQASTRVSTAIRGGKAPRPFAQQVIEVEPEPLTLAARGLRVRFRQRPRFIGRALEHHVERMAGRGKHGVEPARGEVDEAVQLFRPPSSSGRRRGAAARPASRRGRPAHRRRLSAAPRPGARGSFPAACGAASSSGAGGRPRRRRARGASRGPAYNRGLITV